MVDCMCCLVCMGVVSTGSPEKAKEKIFDEWSAQKKWYDDVRRGLCGQRRRREPIHRLS